MSDEKQPTQPPSPRERRNALVERAYRAAVEAKKARGFSEAEVTCALLADLVHELAKELRSHCQDGGLHG